MFFCLYYCYYYMMDVMFEEELVFFKNEGICGEVVKKLEDSLFELYKDLNFDYKLEELFKWGGVYYSDVVCEIINFIYNNKGIVMVVFICNNGVIDDVFYDSVVEIISVICVYGVELINFGKFLLV